MDVRVFAGAQVQTHRFPFKTRVREVNHRTKIQRLILEDIDMFMLLSSLFVTGYNRNGSREEDPPATVPSFTQKENEVSR